LKRLDPDQIARRLAPFLAAAGIGTAGGPPVANVALLLRDRTPTLSAMAEAARYYYQAPPVDRTMLAEQITAANRAALTELREEFAAVDWSREAIAAVVKAASARHGLKPAQVMMPLRALVAGTLKTPAIDAVLELVGRDATRARMAEGLAEA
jgi:glutamyl-tRNA synthetase